MEVNAMCFDKRSFVRSMAVAVALLTMSLTPLLQAQSSTTAATPTPTPTPTPAVDPGPRPVGTVAATAICPVDSAKFPGAPACIDVSQPVDANGNGGAGNVISLTSNLTGLWFQGLTVFETQATVTPQTTSAGASTIGGLGPSFNAESCFQCHSQPAVGGSSPGLDKGSQTPGFPDGNPQVGDAPTADQLTAVKSFITASGPVREARFPSGFVGTPNVATLGNPANVPPGAVAELFVVTTAMTGVPADCEITQEPFATEVTDKNIIFRIPIPTFGDGLVENTPDQNLYNNSQNAASVANDLGITGINFGVFNTSGNDQTITRFGWKAQNKSLLMFAGEASNVEMGVTNELFQNERTNGNGDCSPNSEPEDQVFVPSESTITSINTNANLGPAGVASDISSNIENFAVFMRLNAAPGQCAFNSGVDSTTDVAQCFSLTCTSSTTGCVNPNPSLADVQSIQRGQALFGSLNNSTNTTLAAGTASAGVESIGCVLCHSDSMVTTTSATTQLNSVTFSPFSDFALHGMGGLADGVSQGGLPAGGDQFRSAPLWGIGQRLFFLHDGRATSLLTAINDHCLTPASGTAASEACDVITGFKALPTTCPTTGCTAGTASQQDLLNFLRSL
jgi:CxxC motif-containing protein (DUF1111 family)